MDPVGDQVVMQPEGLVPRLITPTARPDGARAAADRARAMLSASRASSGATPLPAPVALQLSASILYF